MSAFAWGTRKEHKEAMCHKYNIQQRLQKNQFLDYLARKMQIAYYSKTNNPHGTKLFDPDFRLAFMPMKTVSRVLTANQKNPPPPSHAGRALGTTRVLLGAQSADGFTLANDSYHKDLAHTFMLGLPRNWPRAPRKIESPTLPTQPVDTHNVVLCTIPHSIRFGELLLLLFPAVECLSCHGGG